MYMPVCVLILGALLKAAFSQNSSARSFNSDCGQVFTKRQFIIESPNHPSNYPLDYQCSYLVKGPSCPTRFTLEFLEFNVEDSLGCSKDRLEIEDRDALCGNKNNIVKNYFSQEGTLILRFVSDNDTTGRGYRILVTRTMCLFSQSTTQKVYNVYTTNNDVEYTTTTNRPINRNSCCRNFYNSKQFILTSPNFPLSVSSPADCLYEIHKSNANICRLRIHAKFFWLGRSNDDCSGAFLEIDGKYICGCKNDLKIIAPFEGYSTKNLRFVSKGRERSSYSGFVMEIIQDECPKKVVPQSNGNNVTVEKRFRFYNDQINRVAWPNKSDDLVVERLRLIGENTEIIKEDETHDDKLQPQIVKHFYFYSFPDVHRIPRDREDTEYIDTSSKSSFNGDKFSYNYCRNWNQLQFNSLSLRSLPVCKTNQGSVVERKCIELNQLRGYFKSPGYPFYYPGNMNICYKFKKLPGYCTIRVYMKDFDLQDDATCDNDYLLFANQLRYCGRRLANTVSTLDLRNKMYEQMMFVTDALLCGRGFFGAYEQIPCQEFPHPINPTDPNGPPPPYTPPSTRPCSRTVQEEMFTFDVFDYSEPSCTLVIRKYAEYVCSVRIYFEQFDLICAVESLIIDGTRYCGHLTGQSVNIEVTNRDPTIMYQRSSNVGISGLRLRLKGVQVSDDCPYPEVPAERLFRQGKTNWTQSVNESQFLLKFDHHFKNICAIITNTTETKLPDTFCDLIMKKNHNVTECLPLAENSLIVPFNSHKIELKVRDAEKTQEIEFQEIDCDDLPASTAEE